MKLNPFLLLIALGLIGSPLPSQAQEPAATAPVNTQAATFHVEIPEGDKLAINVPANWKHTIIPPTPDHAKDGPMAKVERTDLSVMLQLAFFADPKGLLATPEAVDNTTKTMNMRWLAGSVEGRQKLVQITSATGHGSYAMFTDGTMPEVETAKPGKYRNVLSGMFVIGRQGVAFTILSNGTDTPDGREALKIVTDGITVQK